MADFKIDPEEIKSQLTTFYNARLQMQGAVYKVQVINLDKVDLKGTPSGHLPPNTGEILDDLRGYLSSAQQHGINYLNNVEPEVTTIPQEYVNFATRWLQYIPEIRNLLKQDDSSKTREDLIGLVNNMIKATGRSTDAINGFKALVDDLVPQASSDANNFSEKNSNFKTLESLDEENLKEANARIDTIVQEIKKLNQEIDADMLQAASDINIANSALKYSGSAAGKVKTAGKAAPKIGVIIGKDLDPLAEAADPAAGIIQAIGLAIYSVFIVMASMEINEVITLIDAKFEKLKEETDLLIFVSLLNEQLIGLKTASDSLESFSGQLDSVQQEVVDTLTLFANIQAAFDKAKDQLQDPTIPLTQIFDAFNLGESTAEWEETLTYCTKVQTLDVKAQGNNTLNYQTYVKKKDSSTGGSGELSTQIDPSVMSTPAPQSPRPSSSKPDRSGSKKWSWGIFGGKK